MLVLSRKPGESLLIGGGIRIKIVSVRGQQIRVGVEAPDHVRIIREELHREVAAANRLATQMSDGKVAAIASSLRKS